MGRDWTQVVNVERAMQSLAGIAQGIALDYEVSDAEVGVLTEWLSLHSALLNRQPFKDLADLVARVLEDGKIDDDERDEILDWCQRFSSHESVAVKTTTDALRRLHGVLHGIAADGEVTAQEVVDLGDWLQDHHELIDIWPFCDLHELLDRVLADGVVDDDERAQVLAFCQPFVERAADAGHDGAIGHSLTSICEHGEEISFVGKTFSLTGKAAKVRKHLHAAIVERGGIAVENVSQRLDYLVIGSLSQPAWAYAAYGRKIEEVIQLRRSGVRIAIVHEHHLDHALETLAE